MIVRQLRFSSIQVLFANLPNFLAKLPQLRYSMSLGNVVSLQVPNVSKIWHKMVCLIWFVVYHFINLYDFSIFIFKYRWYHFLCSPPWYFAKQPTTHFIINYSPLNLILWLVMPSLLWFIIVFNYPVNLFLQSQKIFTRSRGIIILSKHITQKMICSSWQTS